jgi:site-specific DNA recombinase
VSTDDQATNGVSLAAQEERLKAYCVARGWSVVRVYSDPGVSGRTAPMARKGLSRALDDAKAGRFDALCIFKLDRLTRSVSDLLMLVRSFERWKVTLVSLSESLDGASATGRLMLNILGSIAEWEAGIIGERTAAALRHKKKHLLPYGQTPLGFERREGLLKPNESELATVRRVFELLDGDLSLRGIAEKLQQEGRRTKAGGRWASETIRKLRDNRDLYRPHLEATEKR